MTEGQPLAGHMVPRVRVLDDAGQPLTGLQVMALVAGNGLQTPFPLRHPPSAGGSSVMPPGVGAKHLLGSVSTITDADGIATFPRLAFAAPGPVAPSTRGAEGLIQTLSFCAQGVCTPSARPEAPTFRVSMAALFKQSPISWRYKSHLRESTHHLMVLLLLQVMTSVAVVNLEASPTVLRVAGHSGPGLQFQAVAASDGEWAMLRVTDRYGNGVPGKQLDVGSGIIALMEDYEGEVGLP